MTLIVEYSDREVDTIRGVLRETAENDKVALGLIIILLSKEIDSSQGNPSISVV